MSGKKQTLSAKRVAMADHKESSRLPVALYVPNIIGYIRIVLLFASLTITFTDQFHFLILYGTSALLDAVDGIAARKLGQTSSLGAFLDVLVDCLTRGSLWIIVACMQPRYLIACSFLVALEWSTFAVTHSSSTEKHWKEEAQSSTPKLVQLYFANNFRNPIGVTGIAGLFGLPLFLYLLHSSPNVKGEDVVRLGDQSSENFLEELIASAFSLAWSSVRESQVPHILSMILGAWLLLGRLMSATIEIWFIWRYVSFLISRDKSADKVE